MAWPPPLPPGGRTNATSQTDSHPDDHNKAAAALSEIVTRMDQNSLLAWTGIDNPASGIITAHNAISLGFTLPSTQIVYAIAQIGVTWGGAPAANDLIAVNLMLDGAWTGVGHLQVIPTTSGTGSAAVQLGYMASLAAGAHTFAWQVSRLTGAQTVTVTSAGFGAVYRAGILSPV